MSITIADVRPFFVLGGLNLSKLTSHLARGGGGWGVLDEIKSQLE